MPKFTAVGGKSGTARIISVHADTKDAARAEITRQLMNNAQRREIWQQWQATGAAIVSDVLEDQIGEAEASFDEAQANALIRGRLAELLAELDEQAFYGKFGPQSDPVFLAMQRARKALSEFAQGVVA